MNLAWTVLVVLGVLVLTEGLESVFKQPLDILPPARLGRTMQTYYKQINNGGPPDPYYKVKAALLLPEVTYPDPSLDDLTDDIQEGLRYVLQTRNEITFPIHGTATGGLNAILDNLIEPGNKVLVMGFGHWGNILANMSERLGADTIHYKRTLGTRYGLQEIELALKFHQPDILAMVMGESDTGVRQPMEGIGELARKYNALLVLDVVAVVGLSPFPMDKLKVDAIATNCWNFGGVPGLAPISLSSRAVEKIRNRRTPPRAYSTDLLLQASMFNSTDRVILHSMSFPLLYGLREVLATIAEEGLSNGFLRHEIATRELSKGLEAIGIKHFVPIPEDRLTAITIVYPPKGKDPHKIVDFMFKNSNIAISFGFGPLLGKVLRISVFGSNTDLQRVSNVLEALNRAILSPETNA